MRNDIQKLTATLTPLALLVSSTAWADEDDWGDAQTVESNKETTETTVDEDGNTSTTTTKSSSSTTTADSCKEADTTEQIMVGVGTLVFGIVAVLLLARIFEKNAINKSGDGRAGRHMGISLGLFLTVLALAGIMMSVTGCFPANMMIWIIVMGVLWAIHGAYTMVSAR
jgi:hypothetical protein